MKDTDIHPGWRRLRVEASRRLGTLESRQNRASPFRKAQNTSPQIGKKATISERYQLESESATFGPTLLKSDVATIAK